MTSSAGGPAAFLANGNAVEAQTVGVGKHDTEVHAQEFAADGAARHGVLKPDAALRRRDVGRRRRQRDRARAERSGRVRRIALLRDLRVRARARQQQRQRRYNVRHGGVVTTESQGDEGTGTLPAVDGGAGPGRLQPNDAHRRSARCAGPENPKPLWGSRDRRRTARADRIRADRHLESIHAQMIREPGREKPTDGHATPATLGLAHTPTHHRALLSSSPQSLSSGTERTSRRFGGVGSTGFQRVRSGCYATPRVVSRRARGCQA